MSKESSAKQVTNKGNLDMNQEPVQWYGYVILLVVLLFLSGVFNKAPGPLAAWDLTNIIGEFGRLGTLGEGVAGKIAPNFRGIGGNGARDAWLYAIWLTPTLVLNSRRYNKPLKNSVIDSL